MKAIVALHFELGYDQELVAEIFGVSQEWVSQEIELVRRILLGKADRSRRGKPYRARTAKSPVTLPDLIKLCLLLAQA